MVVSGFFAGMGLVVALCFYTQYIVSHILALAGLLKYSSMHLNSNSAPNGKSERAFGVAMLGLH